MKALKYTRRILVLLTAISAISMSACDDTAAGIFSRVAAETPISDNMTAAIQGSTPSFVVRLDSAAAYYAGIGTLWTKTDDETAWTNIAQSELTEIKTTSSIASQDSPLFASSAAVIGSVLYVLFSDSGNGEGLGVWSTTNGSTWTPVDAAFPATGYLRTILTANNQLFAVTATSTVVDSVITESYSIHYLNGSSFQPAGITNDSTIGIPNSVAFVSLNYWFTAGASMIKGPLAALVRIDGPSTTDTTSGVCAYDTGIIVSTRNGYLYHYDGVTWTPSNQYGPSTSDGYSLSVPTYVDDKDMLLVGTNELPRSSSDTPTAAGYLQFDLANTFSASALTTAATPISPAINFASSLSLKSVNALPYFDISATKKQVFALTVGDGLWSNTNDGTAWSGWVRE